ncbi:MAG: LicD family protein [Lachnospiraceae bacterium]|nr:LicD family protein [Lachnospiraceae bacterium]
MKLEIPESYFQEEEREGFLVSVEMKRCWAAEMKMLLQVGEVLDRHGLKWYADCGTLLGAVRHHGFVPWDDDIDIIMPRSDYQKAWAFLREELPDHFDVQCSQLDNTYKDPWGCVVNRKDTFSNDKESAAITAAYFGSDYKHVIDIYALDYVSPDGEERSALSALYSMLHELIFKYDAWIRWDLTSQVAQTVEEATGTTLPREPDALRTALWNLHDALSSMYTREDAGGVDILYFWATTGRRPRPVHAYDDHVLLPFEMIEIPVPAGYDEVLRVSYGNNWSSPVKSGGAHNYPYFASEKNEIQNALCERIIDEVQGLESDGRMDEAKEMLSEAIDQFPDRYPLHYLMACATVETDPVSAKRSLENALKYCDDEGFRATISHELEKFASVN